MAKKISLLDRAKGDLIVARDIISKNLSDEVQLDIAAYHTQQGIEKTLKFHMADNNVIFIKTHEVLKLLDQLDQAGISYPDWIYKDHAVITAYATESRYGENFVATKRKLIELLELAEKWIHEVESLQNVRQQQKQLPLKGSYQLAAPKVNGDYINQPTSCGTWKWNGKKWIKK